MNYVTEEHLLVEMRRFVRKRGINYINLKDKRDEQFASLFLMPLVLLFNSCISGCFCKNREHEISDTETRLYKYFLLLPWGAEVIKNQTSPLEQHLRLLRFC